MHTCIYVLHKNIYIIAYVNIFIARFCISIGVVIMIFTVAVDIFDSSVIFAHAFWLKYLAFRLCTYLCVCVYMDFTIAYVFLCILLFQYF